MVARPLLNQSMFVQINVAASVLAKDKRVQGMPVNTASCSCNC
jgi:hypothetical protein